MNMQFIIVGICIAAALIFMAKKLYGTIKRKGCDCGNNTGCSACKLQNNCNLQNNYGKNLNELKARKKEA